MPFPARSLRPSFLSFPIHLFVTYYLSISYIFSLFIMDLNVKQDTRLQDILSSIVIVVFIDVIVVCM